MCIKFFKKVMKKLEWYDIGLIKWSVFFFTLFLVSIWPAFRDLIMRPSPYWYLAAFIMLTIPIVKKMFSK